MHSDSIEYDEILPGEEEVEALWRKQVGINPINGTIWLTPRMMRNAGIKVKGWEDREKVRKEQDKR